MNIHMSKIKSSIIITSIINLDPSPYNDSMLSDYVKSLVGSSNNVLIFI